jgi:hypothetical protein
MLSAGGLRAEVIVDPAHLIESHGPRFDNTAYVNNVWLNGVQFLKDGSGLVDEFGIEGVGVLNFDDANADTPFLKIGVGELLRNDRQPYFFDTRYRVNRLLPVTATGDKNHLAVRQTSDVVNGYGYAYEKTYTLNASENSVRIEYRVRNIGTRPFTFEQYNHCFFQLGRRWIGPSYRVELGTDVQPDPKLAKAAKIDGHTVTVLAAPAKAWRLLNDHPAPGDTPAVTVRNAGTGLFIHCDGDFALSRFALYVDPEVICPETFATFTIAPGETATWSRTFAFGRAAATTRPVVQMSVDKPASAR